MSILSFLLGEKKKSAAVAKERLQLIIAHERGRPPARRLSARVAKGARRGHFEVCEDFER